MSSHRYITVPWTTDPCLKTSRIAVVDDFLLLITMNVQGQFAKQSISTFCVSVEVEIRNFRSVRSSHHPAPLMNLRKGKKNTSCSEFLQVPLHRCVTSMERLYIKSIQQSLSFIRMAQILRVTSPSALFPEIRETGKFHPRTDRSIPSCPKIHCLRNDEIMCIVLFVSSKPRSVTARLIRK